MHKLTATLSILTVAIVACSTQAQPTGGNDFANIPGQMPQSNIMNVKGQEYAPVGACVNLGGVGRNSTFNVVDCGSHEVNYRIVQRVNWPTECVQDADRVYYHNDKQGNEWVACMDLAWSPTYCLSIAKQTVKQVQCNDTTADNRQRPIRLVTNSATVDDCPTEGFAHPIRRFTVCTEAQT